MATVIVLNKSRLGMAAEVDVITVPQHTAWCCAPAPRWHMGLSDHTLVVAAVKDADRAAGTHCTLVVLTRLLEDVFRGLCCRHAGLDLTFGLGGSCGLIKPRCEVGEGGVGSHRLRCPPAGHEAMGVLDEERGRCGV